MWNVLEGLLALAGAWVYIFLFTRCMHRKENQTWLKFWLVSVLFASALTALNFIDLQTRYLTIALCIVYCIFIFKANLLTISFWCLTALVINGIDDFIVTSVSVQFPGITLETAIVPGVPRILCIFAVKLLHLICCYLLTIRIKKNPTPGVFNSVLLLSVPILFWLLLEVFFIYIDALPPSFGDSWLPVAGGTGLLCLLLVSIVLYNNLAVREREIASEAIQLRSAQLTQGHLRQLDELYTRLSNLRHDFLNHVTVIAGLCEEGDLPGAGAYVHTLGDLPIKMCVKMCVYTGNPIADSIISAKSQVMAEKSIIFKTNVTLPPQIPISDVDLSILLGNLLDNAIEAAAKNGESSKRFIRLRAIVKERYWVVICENNSGPGTFQTTDAIRSTKVTDGLHGIGTKQIISTAAKTGGFVSFSQKDAVFSATVMLMLP